MKAIIGILSILVSANAFAQTVLDSSTSSRVRSNVGYWGNGSQAPNKVSASETSIQNVGLTAKVNSQSGSYYKVSGKVTYLNNGQSVEHLFENVGIFFDSKGKAIEGSQDGDFETYLYIKNNPKGETVLFAKVYDTSALPDRHVATSNGVAVPAPEKEKPRSTQENIYNGPKF